ncbi:hypothetical protein VCSRO155_1586 [Vibrio cholerae]|uniref:hypothetical protein n=1 Tax=Vibrio paracholerae TaxID=650003 RepID=UPI0004E3FF85|nr:hypothetical protein [Vibrio paracholerae]KFD80073.1 hypothetical protein DA89_2604 [Vibrio paracholerae]QAV05664.1 hypothetical protein FORC76_2167 [Vibrio cholerae]GHW94846.1 hypothetical protein VCSRO155_1586 [Vibrio cholerae]
MLDHEEKISAYSQVTDMLMSFIDSLDDRVKGISSKERDLNHMRKHLGTGFTAEKALTGALVRYGALSQIQGFEGRAADEMDQIVGMAQIFGEGALEKAQRKAVAMACDLRDLGQFPELIVQHIDRQLEQPKDYAQFQTNFEA